MPPDLTRRLRAAARRATAMATSKARRRSDHDLIRRSGLFDRAWLEAQLGTGLASDEAAIDAYLDAGPDISPHPLVELDWVDDSGGEAVAGRNPLVRHLADEALRARSTHPLFDVEQVRGDLAAHPCGPVAGWLATAAARSPLPTPAGTTPLSLEELCSRAVRVARDHRAESLRDGAVRRYSTPPALEDAAPDVEGGRDGPRVSVVVAPERASAVRPMIDSVHAQTCRDWELIVVDDGAEEDPAGMRAERTHVDPRVVSVRGEGRGLAAALNAGLEQAQGTYVAFLDEHHHWRPDFLQVMLHQLGVRDRPMAHAVLCDARDDPASYAGFVGTRQDLLVRPDLEPALATLVVRRDLVSSIGGFDETLGGAVELDLLLRLAQQAEPHLVEHVGADRVRGPFLPDASARGDADRWASVVVSRHLIDWTAEPAGPPVAGRTSVVLPVDDQQARRSLAWVREVSRAVADAPELQVELVLVGRRLSRSHRTVLQLMADSHEAVRFVPVESPVSTSAAVDVGAVHSTGEVLVVVRPGVEPDVSALSALRAALSDPQVDLAQPLVLDARGVVVSGGAVFGDSSLRPYPFLQGHAPADAEAAGQTAIPAPMGPVLAIRRDTFVALEGLDPLFPDRLAEVDLALRAKGRAVLVPESQVVSRGPDPLSGRAYVTAARSLEQRWSTSPGGSREAWAAAGFEVVDHRNVAVPPMTNAGPADRVWLVPRAVVRPTGATARLVVDEPPPALRWTIDTAAPPRRRGDSWGDTHFARALGSALERRGQRVAVDPRQARHRWSRDLDDVVLVLRGLDQVEPRPGALNMQWVISHPDLVTRDELSSFDLVYAASYAWSDRVRSRWGIPVTPLLQCTDPALFNPGRAEPDTGPALLFVGNARKVYRSAVRSALTAGAAVTLHGAGWEDFVPAEVIASRHVANADVGRLYASAGVVLNDHWEDMRRDGFVSNRLFDATACGARVVTDVVAGLDQLFGAQVRAFSTDADMARLLDEGPDGFPDRPTREEMAGRVIRDHSFDRRAQTLIEDAVRHLRA